MCGWDCVFYFFVVSYSCMFIVDLQQVPKRASWVCLEDTEGLLSGLGTLRFVSDNVESNGLGKGTALSNGNDISFLDREGRTAVGSNVLVSLFETTVLSDVVKVVSSYDDSSLHLSGNDLSIEDSSSDGDVSNEGALLVDEASLDGSVGGLDSKSDTLNKAHRLLLGSSNSALSGNENGILLLVSLFVLIALNVILSYAGHLSTFWNGMERTKKKRK